MNKTNIDWCDSTWNPVTGCKNNCSYCYARNMVHRFSDFNGSFILVLDKERNVGTIRNPLFEINEKRYKHMNNSKPKCLPYPFGFTPTFHKYRLDDYKDKKGRNIFVCSMADLFGDWIPDEWIEEVFRACRDAPQHNYLFLTKNPERYKELSKNGLLQVKNNYWFGTTLTGAGEEYLRHTGTQSFVSIEPLHGEFKAKDIWKHLGWVIIGAETGNRKDKVIPKREWIENIINQCKQSNIPVFMKSSLEEIWGKPLIQEFPEQLNGSEV